MFPINIPDYINNTISNAIDYQNSKIYESRDELTKINCNALHKLINFDNSSESPRLNIVLSRKYYFFSFDFDMLGLNASFPSVIGNVDIDWMLRVSLAGLGYLPVVSHGVYGIIKPVWNSVRLLHPLAGMGNESYYNAPNAAYMWLNEGISLERMFAPALKKCECIK